MANFRIRAKVLDLLGEEQIADCPTAISELFKNSYDAYASRAMMDVYPDSGYVMIWDDGIGMSAEDVEDRWLVIGRDKTREPVKKRKGYAERTIMGEKGIGRLAISTLGHSLFLLTKTKSKELPYTALFINWMIAYNSKLMISDINIPIRKFDSLDELTGEFVKDMVDEFREPIDDKANDSLWDVDDKLFPKVLLRPKIIRQLENFRLDYEAIQRTGLDENDSGTVLFINDLKDDVISYVLPAGRDDDEGRELNLHLAQLLSNFTNRFENPDDNKTDFSCDVRYWKEKEENFVKLEDEWDAISPEDCDVYDHKISVDFDDNGLYRGAIEIFGEKVKLPSPQEQKPRSLSCGPFKLRLWYWQGVQKESGVDKEKWHQISNQLELFGGLLVYRDGLRVLPYGRPEVDWLKFEERRSKGAWRYFFSYRRMFGYIQIGKDCNPLLIDKAGREGLLANSAYRDFKSLLADFFVDIAADHFGKASEYKEKKDAKKAKKKAAEEKQRQVKKRIRESKTDLRQIMAFMKKSPPNLDLLHTNASTDFGNLDSYDPQFVLELTESYVNKIISLRQEARYPIDKELKEIADIKLTLLIEDYTDQWKRFNTICNDYIQKIRKASDEKFPNVSEDLDLVNRFNEFHEKLLAVIDEEHTSLAKTVSASVYETSSYIYREFDSIKEDIAHSLAAITDPNHPDSAFTSGNFDYWHALSQFKQIEFETMDRITEYREEIRGSLEGFKDGSTANLIAQQAGLIYEMQEELDKNLGLVQIGLAVEIIDHDLNQLYSGFKSKIKKFKDLVKSNPMEVELINELGAVFQHIEQRYRLMAPLYRVTSRRKEKITGKRIHKYITEFLEHPMQVGGVEVHASFKFQEFAINESPAVILPVFVNIVDNSIYWVRKRFKNQGNNSDIRKEVLLDIVGDVITINDTGIGISEIILDRIFESMFSTKPAGRGLGLYVAKINLERHSHRIWATNEPPFRNEKMGGACICVQFNQKAIMK